MDEKELVKFHETGCLMFNAPDNNWSTMKQNYIDIGVAFEELNLEQVKERFDLYNFDSFWPPSRPEDHQRPIQGSSLSSGKTGE